MPDHYQTLQTIYAITKEDPKPDTYKCRPGEIILRQSQSWTTIEKHLRLLVEEGMVTIKQEDTIVIFITKEGIEKVKNNLREEWRINLS